MSPSKSTRYYKPLHVSFIRIGEEFNMKDEITKFTGFPKETVKFISGLSKNNNKKWFEDHRRDYEQFYLQPAKAFVIAAGLELEKFAPEIQFEPRINGSIYRINRDIRFSKDKTPYKEHLSLFFWEGQSKKKAQSGFFFRLTPKRIYVGVGAHDFDKDRLSLYRRSLTNKKTADKLVDAISSIEKSGFEVYGEHYKKLPKGYSVKKPYEKLMLYNAMWTYYEGDQPADLHSKAFVKSCVKHWKKFTPLHRWLVDEL
jgi:uncharacterized protein (TIGR02453 family)